MASYLIKSIDKMGTNVGCQGHKLVSVGTNYLLHDSGEVIVFGVPNNLKQFHRYFSYMRFHKTLGFFSLR